MSLKYKKWTSITLMAAIVWGALLLTIIEPKKVSSWRPQQAVFADGTRRLPMHFQDIPVAEEAVPSIEEKVAVEKPTPSRGLASVSPKRHLFAAPKIVRTRTLSDMEELFSAHGPLHQLSLKERLSVKKDILAGVDQKIRSGKLPQRLRLRFIEIGVFDLSLKLMSQNE